MCHLYQESWKKHKFLTFVVVGGDGIVVVVSGVVVVVAGVVVVVVAGVVLPPTKVVSIFYI